MIRLAALCAMVLPIDVARADCHGGGSGGTTAAAYGSHGTSYDNTPVYATSASTPSPPPCVDDSDVVGYRHCTPYGTWGSVLPHLVVEVGVAVRRFASALDDHAATVTHGFEAFSYRTVMTNPSASLDTAVVSTLRIGTRAPHGFYLAVDGELGGLASPAPATAEMMNAGTFGAPNIEQQHGLVAAAAGVVGFHGATRHGSLGVELAGGARMVSYNFHSVYHGCDQTTSIRAFAPVAEARARGELWLSPWFSAGVTVGTSVIERGAWIGGVYLGLHTSAFGGDR